MMLGLSLENVKPIVLDSQNNTYYGPRKLFKIVIDKFNGKYIESWHIEDQYGEKSRDLGGTRCRTLDAIIGKPGPTTGRGVFNKLYNFSVQNLRWTKPNYVNKLIQENKRLKALVDSKKK